MMSRLWVVVCRFKNGEWDICNFTDFKYAHTNYFKAHSYKDLIQKYLQEYGSKGWTKKRFKVVEFKQKKETHIRVKAKGR